MSLAVGVLMDPIAAIKIGKDSTFAMLLEAQRRGVRARLLAQGAQRCERFERLALLELHLRFEHQARHGEACNRRVGAREERLGDAELARRDSRARGGTNAPNRHAGRRREQKRAAERAAREIPTK